MSEKNNAIIWVVVVAIFVLGVAIYTQPNAFYWPKPVRAQVEAPETNPRHCYHQYAAVGKPLVERVVPCDRFTPARQVASK